MQLLPFTIVNAMFAPFLDRVIDACFDPERVEIVRYTQEQGLANTVISRDVVERQSRRKRSMS